MSETNCPFCNFKPSEVIKSNEHALVVLSNPRKVPGHILVLPKRHIEEPWQLTADELTDIFKLIFFVEQRVLGKLGDGVDIRQNYRPFKKQDELKRITYCSTSSHAAKTTTSIPYPNNLNVICLPIWTTWNAKRSKSSCSNGQTECRYLGIPQK